MTFLFHMKGGEALADYQQGLITIPLMDILTATLLKDASYVCAGPGKCLRI